MQNASYNMKWNIIILRLRLRCLHIGYIYYYYEFIFFCDSFQPTKRTHFSFRSSVSFARNQYLFDGSLYAVRTPKPYEYEYIGRLIVVYFFLLFRIFALFLCWH